MKKIILFTVVLLFISGCDGSYNLYISNDEIKENLNFHIEDGLYNEYPLMDFKQYPFYNNTNIFYKNSLSNDNDYKNVVMEYSFKPDEFTNSSSLNTCFSNHEFVNNRDYYYIDLSGHFNCLIGDSFTINIITDNKVISHNADSVNGNTYTWYVNELNKDKLSIVIKVRKNGYEFNYLLCGLFIIILLIIFMCIRLFYKKRDNKDKF